MGRYVFYNEIDATNGRGEKVKDFKMVSIYKIRLLNQIFQISYKLLLIFGALISVLIISSCVLNYKGIGYYQDFNEVFIVDIFHDPIFGEKASFKVKSLVSNLECFGEAKPVYVPGLTCKGTRGVIYAKCVDGRFFKGEYITETCTKGEGFAIDNMGNIIKFVFGLSEEEVLKEAEKLREQAKEKPPLPKYSIKSKENHEKGGSIDKEIPIYSGTGFFVSENGYILTNYHIVEKAKEIKVITYDNKMHNGSIIAKDSVNDIALIKIEGSYPALTLSHSKDIQKGIDVMTIGYPLIPLQGYEMKATFGKINALSGPNNDIRYFQIDVPVQPGNSGGPLIDRSGNIIGIVTATLSQIETFEIVGFIPQNVNYAIKIDYALPLLNSANVNYKISENRNLKEFKDIIPLIEKSIVLIIAK